MLVTVSGIVGSGKSTATKAIANRLRQDGIEPVELWNFRELECFRRLGRRSPKVADTAEADVESPRGMHYTPRTLTAVLAAGYALRILAFRRHRRRRRATHHVCNRYFYDNISHFALRTWQERFWLTFLRLLIPTPDLAILVVASPDTIARRRPNYAPEYLAAVGDAYARLPVLFPELRTISTDEEGALAGVNDLGAALRRS
jgi:thymidylate kinase